LAKHSFKQFFTTLTFNLRKKDYDAALLSCSEKKDPIGKLFLMAIERRGKSKEVIEEAMQRNTITVTGFLERRLQVLATIGSTAPFIGLLGTVFGIIKTFNGLSLIQYAFSSNIITSGISQALINTAAGLIVSIPALIAYNYFVTKINGFLQEIEVASSEVVELLTEQ
jgi:biopolymer transport protein ExbB/TolQ